MKIDIYHIDSFSTSIFHGNPACVVPLEKWLANNVLLNIASENAVAETAFFVMEGNRIHLRWFTPDIEMDLCGHATLATAHVLKQHMGYAAEQIVFDTLSGPVTVTFEEGLYQMDFPSRKPVAAELPKIIQQALNIQPKLVLKSRDYVLVYDTVQEIKDLVIDRQLFDLINLDPGGVVVTAKGEDCDFVSRFFTPQATLLEDPVTGSSHCSLIPFWSEMLQKKEMRAMQLSQRTGELFCTDKGQRVIVAGYAKTYSIGSILL
jgi:PhzF family phenazine biosynthesis protein